MCSLFNNAELQSVSTDLRTQYIHRFSLLELNSGRNQWYVNMGNVNMESQYDFKLDCLNYINFYIYKTFNLPCTISVKY